MQQPPPLPGAARKGPLMMRNVGILLIVCGLFGPALLQRIRPGTGERPPNLTWALAEDGLRLWFFAGVAVWLIGYLRSRKAKG